VFRAALGRPASCHSREYAPRCRYWLVRSSDVGLPRPLAEGASGHDGLTLRVFGEGRHGGVEAIEAGAHVVA
jgi:hypothetical protein